MDDMGLVDWSKIVIDGTKISSSADKELTSNLKGFKKKMERYQKLSEKLLERTKYIDKLESEGKIDKKAVEEEKDKINKQKKRYENVISKIREYERSVKKKEISPKDSINLTLPLKNF